MKLTAACGVRSLLARSADGRYRTEILAPPLELWPVVVRRCQVPADVERLVSRLHEPHNNAVEPDRCSHALAAPARREH
jgi:hypothetical protein